MKPTKQAYVIAGGSWAVITGVIYWGLYSGKFNNIDLFPIIIFLLNYINSQNPEEVNA